jgi:hypothetical protein
MIKTFLIACILVANLSYLGYAYALHEKEKAEAVLRHRHDLSLAAFGRTVLNIGDALWYRSVAESMLFESKNREDQTYSLRAFRNSDAIWTDDRHIKVTALARLNWTDNHTWMAIRSELELLDDDSFGLSKREYSVATPQPNSDAWFLSEHAAPMPDFRKRATALQLR